MGQKDADAGSKGKAGTAGSADEVPVRPSSSAAKQRSIPGIRSSQYSDGHPLDEVQYLECKLILKPDRFVAAQSFLEYGMMVRKTAQGCGMVLNDTGVTSEASDP